MKLIVGLGNPGSAYKSTRHNIGFLAADNIAERNHFKCTENSFNAQITIGTTFDKNILIAKPQTYMNLSGESAAGIAEHYSLIPEDIIVIHDDMDIDFGRIKVKTRGGTAGHKGLESIIECLQSDKFIRVRAGIGKPDTISSPIDYVLQNFTKTEEESMKNVLDNIYNCIETIVKSGPEAAMNKFHSINNQPN